MKCQAGEERGAEGLGQAADEAAPDRAERDGLCPSLRELMITPVLPRLAAPPTSAMTKMVQDKREECDRADHEKRGQAEQQEDAGQEEQGQAHRRDVRGNARESAAVVCWMSVLPRCVPPASGLGVEDHP